MAEGFIRQPKIIDKKNAAPPAMRADDVPMTAESGDFIIGYPAMQQNGQEIKNVVQSAMQRAKQNVKGYKKGDKVDILVHNGEMHIPNEVVNYVEGGYTTLKKLNEPSKYAVGDVVSGRTISDRDEQAITGRTISDSDEQTFADFDRMLNFSYKPLVKSPERGAVEFSPHKNEGTTYGEKLWKKADIKLQNILKTKEFNKGKRINNMIHKEALENLKIAIENGVDTKISGRQILDSKFLYNLAKSTETNHLLNKYNYYLTGDKLNYNFKMHPHGIEVIYPEGTPNLFNKNVDKKMYFDRPEAKLQYDGESQNYLRNNLNRMLAREGNVKKVINSAGGTGYSGEKHSVIFPSQYEELVDFLKNAEGFKSTIYLDVDRLAIGYGHRLQKGDDFKGKQIITEQQAEDLLRKDILEAESLAKHIFEKNRKTKFKDLDTNRQLMLVEMAFNTGNGLKKFTKFMDALENNDYDKMSEEYERKGVGRRNELFFENFIKLNKTK